jgi:hypothetical protein
MLQGPLGEAGVDSAAEQEAVRAMVANRHAKAFFRQGSYRRFAAVATRALWIRPPRCELLPRDAPYSLLPPCCKTVT